MSKHDLQAQPIYPHTREAHLTVVFAALAVSRRIEQSTGWSIKKFIRTTRRHRTIEIQAGPQTITAADPRPDDLREALRSIHGNNGAAHQIGKVRSFPDWRELERQSRHSIERRTRH
jgi:hypothetical protein